MVHFSLTPGSLPNAEPVIGGFALTYAVNAGDYNNDGNADLIGTDNGSPRAAVSLSQVQQTFHCLGTRQRRGLSAR